ncbi:MAG: tail fiber domain-containing protein [Methylobacter sp.]
MANEVDLQASAHADGIQASAGVDGNTVSAEFDNTIGAEASASAGNENASGTVYASVETGQQANFEAGLDGNNVYVDAGASSLTEAHLGAEGQVSQNAGPVGDVGASAGVDAYVQQGMSAEASAQVGDEGIAASGETFAGTAAGVNATGTIDMGLVSSSATGGVSIGEQVGVGAGGEATYKDGELTVGISGEAAALVGVDVDLEQSVDVDAVVDTGEAAVKAADDAAKAAQKAADDAAKAAADAEKAADDAAKAAQKTADDAAKASEKAANDAANAAKSVGSSASKTAKKTGKSIKKAFSDIRLKENIVPAGVKSGINLYAYNYVWDKETRHTGVMAQELLGTSHADAVEMHASGYYQVDYNKLPIQLD